MLLLAPLTAVYYNNRGLGIYGGVEGKGKRNQGVIVCSTYDIVF